MIWQSNYFQKSKELAYIILPRFILRPLLIFIDLFIRKIFKSQSNEANIISNIVKSRNNSNRKVEFIEFGFGPTEFNCINLSQEGVGGLIYDLRQGNINLAKKILHKNTKIVYQKLIPNDLKAVSNPDVYKIISIDVDGNDYEFAEIALKYNKPNLLIVEYNCSFGNKNIKVPFDINFDRYKFHSYYHGASITALLNLAHFNNYCLVDVSENAVNAFFVSSTETTSRECLLKLNYGLELNAHGTRSKIARLSISEQFDRILNYPLVNLGNFTVSCPATKD
jgi:hypothetical protein